jgi:hypothetical protein
VVFGDTVNGYGMSFEDVEGYLRDRYLDGLAAGYTSR